MLTKPGRTKSGSLSIPSRSKILAPQQQKKPQIPPVDQSPSQIDLDADKQPISDLPMPPFQVVSFRHGQAGDLIPLPSLSTAPNGEIPQLTYQKVKQCMRICDFSDPNTDVVSKETKRVTLNELIDVYSNSKIIPRLTRECHASVIEMFATNVFRPMPNIPRAVLMSDDITFEDSAWPHLNLIYILFLKFLEANIDQRILQYQLSPKFISQLFAVLEFPDERERSQAKAVIAAIFNKVPPQRPLLRFITTSILSGVPEGVSFNATGHLLELYYLFNSQTLPPLAPAQIQSFERVILPLHLLSGLKAYHGQLVRCVLLMVRKDARLCPTLLKFLVTHWPLTLDQKSELFIDEVGQVIEEMLPADLRTVMGSLLECITFAAESPSMTLAEKALNFLKNERIKNAITENPNELMSMIFPTLFRVAREHWHKNVQLIALQVMNILMELDPVAFKASANEFKQKTMVEGTKKEKKKILWQKVASKAIKNDNTIDEASVQADMVAYFGYSDYNDNT